MIPDGHMENEMPCAFTVEPLETRQLLSASPNPIDSLMNPTSTGSVVVSQAGSESAGGILSAGATVGDAANNARFAKQLYLDTIGRRASTSELSSILGDLADGDTAKDVAGDLLDGDDYRTALVQSFYTNYLRRSGAPGEVAGWVSQLDAAAPVAQVREGFISSGEYALNQGGGTNEGFIKAAFEDVLNRAGTDTEVSAYLHEMVFNNASRMNVARSLVTSPGAYDAFVNQSYDHLLHREPTTIELTASVAQLALGASESTILSNILGTDEYYTAAISAVIVTGVDAGAPPNVKVFDAASGDLKFSFFAYDPSYLGGVRVASADVSGDGVPDIITAPGPHAPPNVRIFDGVTGEQLPGARGSFYAYDPAYLGGVLVAAGDVNNDGHADIITGVDQGVGPNVKVFSGADGSLLQSFFAYDQAFLGGVRVAAGDVNADGYADIITGAGSAAPHVRVFSGADHTLLRNFMAFNNPEFQDPHGSPDLPETGGIFVSSGDIDADGHDDVLVSRGDGLPQVRTFSGFSNALLHQYNAYDPGFLAGVRIGSADVNHDGYDDIISGPGFGGGSHVKVCNCSAEVELENFFAYDPSYLGAMFVAGGRR